MKKTALVGSLGAAWILTLFSSLLWINNVASAASSYRRLFAPDSELTLDEHLSGFIPALDWATLDISTISTFVPFFGFLCIAIGLHKLLLRGKVAFGESFPFFASYDRINVSLGLIGTVWGIILIGFYQAEDINVATLMMCLHTALFSTLVAVVWVSILIPAFINPWCRYIAGVKSEFSSNGEDINLFEIVEKLTVNAALVSKEFELSNAQLHTFNGRLRNSTEEINECNHNLSGMLHNMTNVGDLLKQEQTRQVEILNQTAKMVESVSSVQIQLSGQLEKLQRENAILQTQNSALRATNNELSESANAVVVENVRLKEELEKTKSDMA